MSKISVIVPVYNTEKYLHRCIDSILAQTFTDFELLLIDDGSKDNSGAICDEYAAKDSRVRVFHKENGGVSSARNLGLDNVRGEWVTFVDSDDWVEKEYIELFVKNIDDLVYQSFQSLFEGQTELWDTYVQNKIDRNDSIIELHNKGVLGYCWGKLYRAIYIEANNIRFNEEIRFREDELFVLDYLLHTKHITCVVGNKYIYNRPNWKKYDDCNDTNMRLLLYKAYKKIFPFLNEITDRFLLDVVGDIISQYNLNNYDYEILKKVQEETKKEIFRLKQLSFMTRIVWRMHSIIAYAYLVLKSIITH